MTSRFVTLALASCLAWIMMGSAGAARMLTTCSYSCPNGWEVVPYINKEYSCDYSCLSPVKLNCVGKYTPKSAWQKLSQPYLCGGTSKKQCPAIACGYTSTYAVSGPEGCAFAKSVIDLTAISVSAYSYAEAGAYAIKDYCNDPSNTPLQTLAWAAANAYAEVVVKTIAHWNVYVCNCGCGTLSGNYAVVKADLQSVANATAQSYAEAFASVETCFGDLLAGALQITKALATDTQLAIDKVYAEYVYAAPGSSKYGKCQPSGLQTQIKTAVAQAAACAYAQVFAAAANEYAMNNDQANLAYACGQSISFTQADLTWKCPPYGVGCACTPEYLGYTNLGFEQGIPGANPTWHANAYVTAVTSATDLPLYPSEGSKMAKISAGCTEPGQLYTEVKVPQCADNYGSPRVLLDYVFKCNDYLPFNDAAVITLTLTDAYGAAQFQQEFKCSDVGDYGATNGGKWATLALPTPPGTYKLSIEAAANNDKDCLYNPSLYIDNIRFK